MPGVNRYTNTVYNMMMGREMQIAYRRILMSVNPAFCESANARK